MLTPFQIIGIANGLDYLHSCDVIHGDFGGVRNRSKAHITAMLTPRQPHVFVDDSGRPRITGFGLTDIFSMRTSSQICCCIQWAEPGCWPSLERDVFSFSMVMVQVGYEYWPQPSSWPTYSPPRHRFSLVLKIHLPQILLCDSVSSGKG